MNDGNPKPPFIMQYVSVDAVIEGVLAWCRGTLMAKFDVASAYRNVAIHPDDRPLLGMQWHGKYFVDMVLLFGLRSASFISNLVPRALFPGGGEGKGPGIGQSHDHQTPRICGCTKLANDRIR